MMCAVRNRTKQADELDRQNFVRFYVLRNVTFPKEKNVYRLNNCYSLPVGPTINALVPFFSGKIGNSFWTKITNRCRIYRKSFTGGFAVDKIRCRKKKKSRLKHRCPWLSISSESLEIVETITSQNNELCPLCHTFFFFYQNDFNLYSVFIIDLVGLACANRTIM